jgi:Raf kinase inhibitor-like YbhB/YbcL family protein
MDFIIRSSAFINNGRIPTEYTCDGSNISPELEWYNAPEGTKSFALIVDDPDASNGTWDHWILFNIPNNINKIECGTKAMQTKINMGKNSWGKSEYGGPCPPPHSEHRYFFKMYALDDKINLPDNSSKQEIENTIEAHILAKAVLIGKYSRKHH